MASGSTFPQLFRQSAFATFDPSITRVYTSTQSSVKKHGDWGIKKPIFRRKGPKYIKVSNLDAGRLLGSDWRPAEAEARFMKTYGDGRVQWSNPDERDRAASPVSLWDDAYTPPGKETKPRELIAEVNAMTNLEFKEYLDSVRKYRNHYLEGKLLHLREETLAKLALPEDRTMVNLSARGHVNNGDVTNFQVGLTRNMVENKNQFFSETPLISRPHRTHGLSYSRQSTSSSASVSDLAYHQGRVVDRQAPYAQSRRAGVERKTTRPTGQNLPWIVSIGGLTANSDVHSGRISDTKTAISESIDLERKDRERGTGLFKISSAIIKEAPRVVDLPEYFAGRSIRVGGRMSPTPLNTFEFDVDVDPVSEETAADVRGLASKEWVKGKEKKVIEDEDGAMLLDSWRDPTGLGGNRPRSAADAQRQFNKWESKRGGESRQKNADVITGLLERLSGKAQK